MASVAGNVFCAVRHRCILATRNDSQTCSTTRQRPNLLHNHVTNGAIFAGEDPVLTQFLCRLPAKWSGCKIVAVFTALTPASSNAYKLHAVSATMPQEKILSYLKSFAESRKLEWQQDEVGNLVIRRPGSGGGENAPPVVIQARAGVQLTLLVPMPMLPTDTTAAFLLLCVAF